MASHAWRFNQGIFCLLVDTLYSPPRAVILKLRPMSFWSNSIASGNAKWIIRFWSVQLDSPSFQYIKSMFPTSWFPIGESKFSYVSSCFLFMRMFLIQPVHFFSSKIFQLFDYPKSWSWLTILCILCFLPYPCNLSCFPLDHSIV